ncbi:hypothetical protein ACFL6H_04335 [Candidatus Latescibacterota bacterium]
MTFSETSNSHSFHIPVMGTGFTIDTPLKVAKYGISSVISLVDDTLIEQMRKLHSEKSGHPYVEIPGREDDSRARRITAYVNLLDILIKKQVRDLQSSSFEKGSEITKYYEMLPENPIKQTYRSMLAETDPVEKARLQKILRKNAVPGSIDVNIMTKLDRDLYRDGEKLPPEYSDAIAGLKGFANSTLESSIICSAGMNQRFYNYFSNFDDFFPDNCGNLKKKIVLKVSDYRSAFVQGKYLAKRGLWVSEYRIESGLNCGGHAFASQGYLMGPILDEFKSKKQELIDMLDTVYSKALAARDINYDKRHDDIRITVQGGIGTAGENELMLKYYNIDGTGWGTPFLLVPEAVNMDQKHLELLTAVRDGDVYLSESSPIGIPFWNLRTSASENARRQHIKEGNPGSSCPKGHLRLNSEFTEIPICQASRAYQKRKLEHLEKENLSSEQRAVVKEDILAKSCICHDLAGVATVNNGIDKDATSAICCGPNIVNFSKIATLEEMVDHIYGRLSLMTNPERPNMFIKEIMLYIDYLKKEIEKHSLQLSTHTPDYLRDFQSNLLSGIDNYTRLAEQFFEEQKTKFLEDLNSFKEEIENIPLLSAELCVERSV